MFNPYIVVPFMVWAITQFLKFILAASRGDISLKYLYGSGGMPSVHSAVVMSLAVTAFLIDGPRSPIFGITVILASIVMYDSFGVRRSSGEQAVAINLILGSMDRNEEHHYPHLREVLGHRPLEVAVGGLMGLVLACVFNYTHLGAFNTAATMAITRPYIYGLAGVGLAAIIAATIGRRYYLRKYRKVAVIEQATRRSSSAGWTFGVLAIILAGLEYEKISGLVWVAWPILLVGSTIITLFAIAAPYRSTIPHELERYRQTENKAKWLEGPNKKKRAKTARSKRRA